MGETQRTMVAANPVHKEFQEIIIRQIKRLVEIGADGVHIDKFVFSRLDFNPSLNITPDQACMKGILDGTDKLLKACREENEDFCISVEGAWDFMLQYTGVTWAWHQTWDKEHLSVFKYTFPQWKPCLAVDQPFDYNVVNNAIRYGCQIFLDQHTILILWIMKL